MKDIILYGSKYGSCRQYAQKLSLQTKIPAVSYKKAPAFADYHTIVYMGSLYAGGVLGLAKTLRKVTLQKGQRLLIVTVGLSDPAEAETRENIRALLQKQIPKNLFSKAKIFHLRGRIDYHKLHVFHRILMALLHCALRKTPKEKWTAEERVIAETYGKNADFTNYEALDPLVEALQNNPVPECKKDPEHKSSPGLLV